MKGISVVIPNYNGTHLLKETLPTVFIALQETQLDFEIIISDDCSTDDSIYFLETSFPSVKTLRSTINKGFSPTINKGIFASQYDLVLLLNSDVKLTPDYFKNQLRYFDMRDTFGVMGRIVGWNDEVIQDAGKYPKLQGAKIKTSGNYYQVNPHKSDALYSMYLSGANALVDRKKLMLLGGFNEIFAPFYVEDFELSLRAWRMGWKCYYDHFSVCRHQVSTSIKAKSKKKFIQTIYNRNKFYLHAIHLPRTMKAIWYLQLIPEMFIRLFTFRFYYFSSLTAFLSNKKLILHSRNNFKNIAEKENVQLLSVKDVIHFIQNSISGKKIIKF